MGAYESRWDRDLAAGKAWEREFFGLLRNARIENKLDRMAWKTGFLFVEYESRGKPSGIATTEADWWVFGVQAPDGTIPLVVMAKTNHLKALARLYWKTWRNVDGGDNGTSKGILLEPDELMRQPK